MVYALQISLPDINIWDLVGDFDFSGICNIGIFIALLFAGLFAFGWVPAEYGLNWIAGFTLIGLGIAILMGWVVL